MKTTKTIALLLAVLMLICTIGCNTKSIELTLNDGVLENDYFSIDVSGYEEIAYTKEDLTNEQLVGSAYAMSYTNANGGTSVKQYVQIFGYKNAKSTTIPNKDYYEMQFTYEDVEVLSFKYINDDPNLGSMAELLYISDDGQRYYTFLILFKSGKRVFKFDIGDKDGTEERFEGYTTAIDSFKVK